MREIKFRAWTGREMEYRMVVGALGAFYVEGIDPKDAACLSPFNTKYSDQTQIMQFTGLHDKNGHEIYEGDIVRVAGGNLARCSNYAKVPQRGDLYDVIVLPSGFTLRELGQQDDHLPNIVGNINNYNFWNAASTSLEVIGNIYENPELLEVAP